MSAPEPLLVVEHLSRSFGGLRGISNVSLSVDPAEAAAIIGPNGSGKTTLFNVVSGVYAPDSGSVGWGGADITGAPRHRIARLGLARTFQTPRLFPSLSALAHVVLAARTAASEPTLADLVRHAWPSWDTRPEQARAILARVGLAAEADVLAGALPYGKRRLLEIARCLATRPALLLLDEPAAGLNDVESGALGRLLADIGSADGIAMLVIDHNIPFVRALCRRLVVLHQGELLCDGPTDVVLCDVRVKDAYLGWR